MLLGAMNGPGALRSDVRLHQERPRLIEIRDNLTDRIAEAEREGWLSEVEGLSTSRAAAEEKIAQLDSRQERRNSSVFLGIPTFDQIAARTSDVKTL